MMTEENIWKVYNFVNDWKNGSYGIIDIQTAASGYLKLSSEISQEDLDEESEQYLAEHGAKDFSESHDAFMAGAETVLRMLGYGDIIKTGN